MTRDTNSMSRAQLPALYSFSCIVRCCPGGLEGLSIGSPTPVIFTAPLGAGGSVQGRSEPLKA